MREKGRAAQRSPPILPVHRSPPGTLPAGPKPCSRTPAPLQRRLPRNFLFAASCGKFPEKRTRKRPIDATGPAHLSRSHWHYPSGFGNLPEGSLNHFFSFSPVFCFFFFVVGFFFFIFIFSSPISSFFLNFLCHLNMPFMSFFPLVCNMVFSTY